MNGKEVLLADVLKWLKEAIEAAYAPSDSEGAITPLRYRELAVEFVVRAGDATVRITTHNAGYIGQEDRVHRAITHDGAKVTWEERDVGIPTGADWLPREFVEWMKGGGP
jgi:hypothetical protein